MHPRTQVRNELKALLSELPSGAPVFMTHVRELRRDEKFAVGVFVPNESFAATAGRPIERTMNCEIVVVTQTAGTGEDAVAFADTICRDIEMRIADGVERFEFLGSSQDLTAGSDITCVSTITVAITYFDNLES
jgi:hypothetical protein